MVDCSCSDCCSGSVDHHWNCVHSNLRQALHWAQTTPQVNYGVQHVLFKWNNNSCLMKRRGRVSTSCWWAYEYDYHKHCKHLLKLCVFQVFPLVPHSAQYKVRISYLGESLEGEHRWTQAAHLTSAAEDHNCLYSQTWFYVCFCLGNCSFHTSVLWPRCRHRTHSLVVKWSAYTCPFYMKLLSSISHLQALNTVWWQSKPGYYWHFFNDMSGRARGSAVAI